ncbi:DsbA family oxidoreductase [Dictyobacter arantiisoli]|uniref:Thioredoxin-like reductase n=1 Tax=Dictyobacter arantiisoli TaxID=2014874 RepID=A0A5A5TFS5_9CHLR|nr:DsbA family protein [Dictyobacter arantiisoli]GCF10098.1 thioredoxin-like reductase [Dictyobacter arantiisoli]
MSVQETKETLHINFHTDPLCPLAWRTALWAREARQLRPIEITWRLFSLEIVNRPAGAQPDYVNGRGWTALRTLSLARRLHGNETFEKLYIELGNAAHGRKEDISDRKVVEASAEAAGLGAAFVEQALADDATRLDVISDHEEAVKRYHAFGVPTIALADSHVGYYGPVIHSVPKGEEAAEMWDHFVWALHNANLFELKRDRAAAPPFEPVFA